MEHDGWAGEGLGLEICRTVSGRGVSLQAWMTKDCIALGRAQSFARPPQPCLACQQPCITEVGERGPDGWQ